MSESNLTLTALPWLCEQLGFLAELVVSSVAEATVPRLRVCLRRTVLAMPGDGVNNLTGHRERGQMLRTVMTTTEAQVS